MRVTDERLAEMPPKLAMSPDTFYGERARELAKWSLVESNRIKASTIYQAALKMEGRYRTEHPNEVNACNVFPCHAVAIVEREGES